MWIIRLSPDHCMEVNGVSHNPFPFSLLLCSDGSTITQCPHYGRPTGYQLIPVGLIFILDTNGCQTWWRQGLLSRPRVQDLINPDHLSLLGFPLSVVPVPCLPDTRRNIRHTNHHHPVNSGRCTILGITTWLDRDNGWHLPYPLCLTVDTSAPLVNLTSHLPANDTRLIGEGIIGPLNFHGPFLEALHLQHIPTYKTFLAINHKTPT